MAEEEAVKYTYKQLEKELKESHKDFAKEYFRNGWIKVKAYMKAYPESSYDSACVSACELLRNPKILAYIEFLKSDLEKVCGITKAKQLSEYAKIAYSSIAHMHNTWISLRDFEEIDDVQKEAIESIDTKTIKIKFGEDDDSGEREIEYVKIKLYSKTTALDAINKMMGYNEPDKVDHTTKGESMNLGGLSTEELIKRGKSCRKIEDEKE